MNYWHQRCIAWDVVYWFTNRYKINYVLKLFFKHILSIQSYEFDRFRLKVSICWVYRWSNCKMIEINSFQNRSNFDDRIAWRSSNRNFSMILNSCFLQFTIVFLRIIHMYHMYYMNHMICFNRENLMKM